MGDYSTGNDQSRRAKISKYCFQVYLFLFTLFLIACILFWPGLWDMGYCTYSNYTNFINPISLIFGALGAILRRFSESPISAFTENLPAITISSWDYFEPIIGAVFGVLSLLAIHVIVDRFVLSSYKLDPISISLIALYAGLNIKQLLKRFCRKKYVAVKLLK